MAFLKESETLTQVGPSTPMGELMRQYWIPAAMSSELKPDGDPVRLVLLGEKLIAFRDSHGRVGIMDHRCPHRCASLFFARNEEGGLRCVYHGWKFDAAGACIDMPNVPPDQDYRNKVTAKAYRTAERNGLVWVYMGPRQSAPPLPIFESMLLPDAEVRIAFAQRECNWMQALEGDIDTTHFSFLHVGAIKPGDIPAGSMARYAIANRAAQLQVKHTPWGTMYGAQRQVDDKTYWRFAQFLFPFWTMIPEGDFAEHIQTRAWVPMDDTHTMYISLLWTKNRQRPRQLVSGKLPHGFVPGFNYLPNSTDWYGRWRLAANAENDYMVDREAQRTGASYTGINGIFLQDQAVTESMGAITDHSFERLGPSDSMIIQTRRRLVQAASDLTERGVTPPCVDEPEVYLAARGGDFVIERPVDWLEAYQAQMKTSVDPTGRLRKRDFQTAAQAAGAAK